MIISSCLFVCSFVFVLVSRGRGGVLEGLGKKIDTRKRRFRALLSDFDRMKEFLKLCVINFVCP